MTPRQEKAFRDAETTGYAICSILRLTVAGLNEMDNEDGVCGAQAIMRLLAKEAEEMAIALDAAYGGGN